MGVDIIPEFWSLGHKLFKSSPETFTVPFLAGDIFDASFLETIPPVYTPAAGDLPELKSAKTLSEFRSAITVCSVFHLFNTEEEQLQLLHVCYLRNLDQSSSVDTMVFTRSG
ncbi:hypothetical protein C8Q80DRAFT_320839 [Daedaleopsis nitida]|nr:hypothetical protein C8Q80DRAFT_320839 [Daedaleopsis nitida]